MEKVTIYGHVRPGRGERLPRVDFSESPRIDSPPPLEAGPLHHDGPAPQQARRRNTRLLPNLRFLRSYDEDRPEEERTAADGGFRLPRRQCCQVYENLGAQQEQVQPRRSLASENCRSEETLGTSTIGGGSSREESATLPRTSTTTALSERVAASRAVSRSYNTMSTAMKTKPQKLLQKSSVATLPRPKHKKTLTGGRQIKTHLRCEHLLTGPVWGGGDPSARQEQRSDDSLTKRMALERHRIASKIDALCAVSARRGSGPCMGDQVGYAVGKGKRGREVEEEGLPPAAKHSKLIASGRQYKTHLNYQQSPDQRRLQARPVTTVTVEEHVGDGKFRERQCPPVSSHDGTSDEDDECNERQRSYTEMGGMESNRKRGVLKSNIKTPRRSFRNVYEEAGSHSSARKALPRSGASGSYGAADADIHALPQRGNSYKKCDLLRRSSCFSCSDCVYCREDTYHSLRSRCNLCPDVSCSHVSQNDVRTAPLPDDRPNGCDELCPVCHRESTSLRDGRSRRSSRGYYQNSCHFCGMVFGGNEQPVVSEDGDLLYGSCDHHNGSSRSESRPCGDRPQRPSRTEQCGNHGGAAAADKKKIARRASLEDERPQTSVGSVKTTRRDREERSSAPRGGKRPQNPPPRTRAEGQFPRLDRPYSYRHGSGVEKSTTVQLSDFSKDAYDKTTKRARFEASDAFESDKRTNNENSSGNDVRDFVGAGILKNSINATKVIYTDNLQENIRINYLDTTAPCDQLKNDNRQGSHGEGARQGYPSSCSKFDVGRLSRGVGSKSRKENLRPSVTRGTENAVRVRRHPTHSLVLEDHL